MWKASGLRFGATLAIVDLWATLRYIGLFIWATGCSYGTRGGCSISAFLCLLLLAEVGSQKDNINARILQTMISEILVVLGLKDRMQDPHVHVVFVALRRVISEAKLNSPGGSENDPPIAATGPAVAVVAPGIRITSCCTKNTSDTPTTGTSGVFGTTVGAMLGRRSVFRSLGLFRPIGLAWKAE